MPAMDPDTSLTTAEQALRDLLRAVMYKEYGAGWMDTVVTPALREQWKNVREQEARQRVGHTLGGVTDLSYAFLQTPPGDLIESKGSRVDVSWTVRAADTGPKKWVLVKLTHEGPYHRNVQGIPNADAIVLFYYRVLPPSS